METNNVYLASKPRYEILDGLRGVAALIVLFYHHFEIFCMSDPMMPFINHGYLAVDFFFILSGFVIGYAYDDRWEASPQPSPKEGGRRYFTTWQFFKRRLTRLHPMIIFATVMCMCTFYFGMGKVFPLIQSTSFTTLLLFGVISTLMIPVTPAYDIRGWAETNPINGNAWTLYFEYFANIAYALVIRRFPKWLLTIFVIGTAVLTLDLTLNINMFGFLTDGRGYQAYTVIGGWTTNLEQSYIGFVRLLYPFFCGLLISRILVPRNNSSLSTQHSPLHSARLCRLAQPRTFNFQLSTNNGWWWTCLFLIVVLCMPRLGGIGHGIYNGIYEAISILILFPVIVTMGAWNHVTGRSAAICKWLGNISYPLYVTHYGIVFGMVQPWAAEHPDITTGQAIGISLGSILLSIFIAHAAFTLYDIPVRNWLREHWLKKAKG